MNLTEGRREQMERDANAAGSCIPCHDNLYVGAAIEPVCKGYFDVHDSLTLQMAERMGLITFTNGDTDT